MAQGRNAAFKRASVTWVLAVSATAIFAREVLSHPSAITTTQGAQNTTQLSQKSVQPQTRLLYVLDTTGWRFPTEVLLVDAVHDHVLKKFSNQHAGYGADMALSPDGSRLYVSSGRLNPGIGAVMDTFDTYTGNLITETENPDFIVKQQIVYRNKMVISPTGKYIYMLKMKGESGPATLNKGISSQDADDLYVTAFDTEKGQFLPLHVSLSPCNDPVALPTNQDLVFDVVCSESYFVLEIAGSESGAPPKTTRIPITGYHDRVNGPWATAFELPDERKIALFARDGSRFAMNPSSGDVQIVRGTFKSGTDVELHRGATSTHLGFGYFAIGQTSGGISYGLGGSYEKFDCIEEMNLATLRLSGEFCPSSRFYSMALSRDGNILYAVNPVEATITVIDATTMKESGELREIGTRPIFAVAAP